MSDFSTYNPNDAANRATEEQIKAMRGTGAVAPAAARTPIFVECSACGERWKVATVAGEAGIEALQLVAALARCKCPNCFAERGIMICPTQGEHAVTTARDGRALE